MGMTHSPLLSGSSRSVVSLEARRRAFLKHVYELGFHDGYYCGEKVRERDYDRDEEAQMRYRIGFRIGRRENARV